MFRRKITSLSLVFGAIAILCSTVQVFAATSAPKTTAPLGSGNALKVSPVRTDVEIKPGTSQVIDVYVQNLTNTAANLKAIVNDFVANKDETGTPNIILDSDQSAPTHSLRQFVSAVPDFMLQPNEQKDVKVTINIPKTAQPGGYFGLVRFAPATAGGEQSVTLSASVGSLILAEVPGNIKENLAIASFDVRKDSQPKTLFTSGKNLQAVVRFQNSGDIQEQPFGKILIRKGGATVASYEINTTLPRGDVLPDSIRRFSISLDKLGSFGKYTMEGNFGYGSHGQLLTATRTFYIIPISLVIIVILAIFLILFAVFIAPNLVKKYNRRIVQKAIGKKRRS